MWDADYRGTGTRKPVPILAKLALVLACFALLGLPGRASATLLATPTIAITHDVLTPLHSGGCYEPTYPCYRVHGVADPGVDVIVTVTDDGLTEHSVVIIAHATKKADPGAGTPAGFWAASPNVTDLGTHDSDPALLTFEAIAKDDAGNLSIPATVTATKVAITNGDTMAPRLQLRKRPPDPWCRSGLLCLRASVTPPRVEPHTGQANISGWIIDDYPETYGLASEIADVVIRILDPRTGEPWVELRNVHRRGTGGSFDAVIFAEDFEPFVSYTGEVQAFDAWGHASNVATFGFLMLP